MSSISFVKASITDLDCDAVVNAANDRLMYGGGVCGCIFRAAGVEKLKKELEGICFCPTGGAVITAGCDLKARYIIHAVGPIYQDGLHDEARLLSSAYKSSLELATEHRLGSIAFSLISSGIYRYPKREAFIIALKSCAEFINERKDYEIDIIFALIDESLLELGKSLLKELNI
ncbi:MAG: macro domain-containing protein [Succinivibrio sp.]|nr:macro domain-containing protein [Succinivibrio sp.]